MSFYIVEEIEKDIIKNEKLLHAITAPRKITSNSDYLIDWYDKVLLIKIIILINSIIVNVRIKRQKKLKKQINFYLISTVLIGENQIINLNLYH